MNLAEEKSKNPLVEIAHYRDERLWAIATKNRTLVLRWKLATDAAKSFFKQQNDKYILLPQAPSFSNNLAKLIQSTQEANYHLNTPKENNFPHWIFATDETKEAAKNYRHWMARSQAITSKNFQHEIKQAMESATKYRPIAPEAAGFAEKAAHYFSIAQKAENNSFDEITIHRWRTAAYEAAHVAKIHLHFIAMKGCNNELLTDHWMKITNLAEQALHSRIKAAEATEQGHEQLALSWSLLAYSADNDADVHLKLLELFPFGDNRAIAHWQQILSAAEAATEQRVKALKPQTSALVADYYNQAALWSEHSSDFKTKAFETTNNEETAAAWEEASSAAMYVSKLWIQAAQRAADRTCFGIAAYYWSKRARHAENKIQKKSFLLLIKEVSFCLPEHALPDDSCKKTWAERKTVPEVEYQHFYSWIYQTWDALQKAGVACKLATELTGHGIAITACGDLSPTFRTDPSFPRDLFLVDTVADSNPHPSAHLYLLQNRTHAKRTSTSLFVPHWPERQLISRNPRRGNRFENIIFFGHRLNLAPELRSEKWKQRLQNELGLFFEIQDTSRWNDYSTADCVIAIRDFSKKPQLHKPATKLYNAWLAGVPFIGGADSAYAADGHSGKDYLVATSLEEVFQHLKRLKEDEGFRTKLVQNGLRSGAAFTREATLERWKKLVQEILPALALQHYKKLRHSSP